MDQEIKMMPASSAAQFLANSRARFVRAIPGGKLYQTGAGIWIQAVAAGGQVKMVLTRSCAC